MKKNPLSYHLVCHRLFEMYCVVLTILFLCKHQRHNCKSLENHHLNDKIISF